jgi:hypothetical protein
MHAIISSFVAAILSIHALLGCCWHHARGCEVCETTIRGVASSEVSPETSCCHHVTGHRPQPDDACGGGHRPSHSGPCKCRIDCCGSCAFLPAPRALEIAQVSGHGDDCLVACLPAIMAGPSTPSLFWRLVSGPTPMEPPLRLHLLHQILLI